MAVQHDPNIAYQILIAEQFSEHWADWFEGMDISHNQQGNTILTGQVIDQPALQGILSTIGLLNMTLISVTQIDIKPSKASQTNEESE